MKKSEFIKESGRRARQDERLAREWSSYESSLIDIATEVAATVAEEGLGVQWDPEEEEEVLNGDIFTHDRSGLRFVLSQVPLAVRFEEEVEDLGEWRLYRYYGDRR